MIPSAAIVDARVWHRRLQPFEHRFAYRLGMVWCDLDQPEALLTQHWSWGKRWRPVTFRDQDYVDRERRPLAEKVRAQAAALGLDWRQGRVMMLAQWRSLGTLFNPLVLYLHFPAHSEQPDSVLAEVQNTPWKQRHFYALPLQEDGHGGWRYDHDKAFHVSPFLPMALRYHWHLHVAFPNLHLTLEDRSGEQTVFQAGVTMTLLPPEKAAMAQATTRFAAQGLKTLARIYWQAWRLWRKGARFHSHPGRGGHR